MGYVIKRLLGIIPVLLGITLLVFWILHLIPGDPASILLGERASPDQVAMLRQQLGLDQPWLWQYGHFLGRMVQGDLGQSIISGISVLREIQTRLPATIELAIAAMAIALALGIPAGILAAVHHNRWPDYLTTSVALVGVSLPVYWLGLLLAYLFAVNLHWLPASGRLSDLGSFALRPRTQFHVLDALLQANGSLLLDALSHLLLPALTLATIPLAVVTRITRTTMLDVLSQDYIRTAHAKGLPNRRILLIHALRNALLPIVTLSGIQFGTLLGGAILTETIFSWPGIGAWIYDGILARDYPVVQGGILFVSTLFVLVNLMVDLSYALIDPRIRY